MAYTNTLITISEDCPISVSEIPVSTRSSTPIHIIYYTLLMGKPYYYDHKSLIFEVFLTRRGLLDESIIEKNIIYKDLFSKGQPCLRTSSLTKRYGFGAHYNEKGKIALYPVESREYQALVSDDTVKKVSAMRFKRK